MKKVIQISKKNSTFAAQIYKKKFMKPTLFVLAAGMGSRYGGLKQLDGLGPNGKPVLAKLCLLSVKVLRRISKKL